MSELADLKQLCAEGALGHQEYWFARFLADRLNASPPVALAGALVSREVSAKGVCLDLGRVAGAPVELRSELEERTSGVRAPARGAWLKALKSAQGVVKQYQPGQDEADLLAPLVLDESERLYLQRYFLYELSLARRIVALNEHAAALAQPERLKALLDGLFPAARSGARAQEPDLQREAAQTALTRRVTAITGGPGTGKTTTVLKILIGLIELSGEPRIALAAPTGKAAHRMTEAITFQLGQDPGAKARRVCQGMNAAFTKLVERVNQGGCIPGHASTLHRLLGTIPGSAGFRHNHDVPLPFDVVVVDEASMVDLPLMAKLLEALPDDGRLILLGDQDQLASVEAGSVLADICKAADQADQRTRRGKALAGSVVRLVKSHRFKEDSGIKQVLDGVNAASMSGYRDAWAVLTADGAQADVTRTWPGKGQGLRQALAERAAAGFVPYLERVHEASRAARYTRAELEGIFAAFGEFSVLCALRRGPCGSLRFNELIEEALSARRAQSGAALIRRRDTWYAGRPVMITTNDYQVNLFNGDVGIVLEMVNDEGEREHRVVFPDRSEESGFRAISPLRLPACETVYAMTVHKSQGSEYDRVLMVLPDRPSPILSRELVYTGISRAKRSVEVWSTEAVFMAACARSSRRTSGLVDRLGEDCGR